MTRKTKTALITVCLLLTVTVVYALAAAGGASDPLASLSYLTGTFTDAVDQRVEEKLDASDLALLNGDATPGAPPRRPPLTRRRSPETRLLPTAGPPRGRRPV